MATKKTSTNAAANAKANAVAKPAQSADAKARAERRRQTKEVATKLRNLSPAAKAEVVNQAVNIQLTKQVGGFVEFLREQSVIGIGIGLVLGTQIKTVVDAIMQSFVDPITRLVLPGEQLLTDKVVTISIASRHAVIGWGNIAYAMFSFIMVALIVYTIFKLLKLDKLTKKK
jgi:large-conductance mechanosensitive channel